MFRAIGSSLKPRILTPAVQASLQATPVLEARRFQQTTLFKSPAREQSLYKRIDALTHNNQSHYSRNLSLVEKTAMAFDECCLAKYNPRHPAQPQQQALFATLTRAMGFYRTILPTLQMQHRRVADLLHLIATAMKCNISTKLVLKKKADNDSRSTTTQNDQIIITALQEIVNDALENKVSLNSHSITVIMSLFERLHRAEDGLRFWNAARIKDDDSVKYLSGNVVGRVLPFLSLYTDEPFEAIQALYQRSRELSGDSPALSVGMISVCLKFDQVEEALDLFETLVAHMDPADLAGNAYLYRAHNEFICNCSDLSVAEIFLDKALTGGMPYTAKINLSTARAFVERLWASTKDFARVRATWEKVWRYYAKTNEDDVNNGAVSGSWNHTFMTVLFEKYPSYTPEAVAELKDVIRTYSEIKMIDEPFLNVVLNFASRWKQSPVIESINQAYDIYSIPRSQVSLRSYLKALGSVEALDEQILAAWSDLVMLDDRQGYRYLSRVDMKALKDATVLSDYGAARRGLFFAIFKVYGPLVRSPHDYATMVREDIRFDPEMRQGYAAMERAPVEIELPQFKNLEAFQLRRGA